MNRKETAIVLQILKTAYPRLYSGPDAPDMADTLNLWAEMFEDDDVGLVAAAVKSLIANDEKGYLPHIGAIKNEMYRLSTHSGLDAAGAWSLVRKAVQNSGYEAREEFEKLPESVRRIVGSPSQLRDWAMMDSGTLNSVVASNFQRAFRNRKESERRDALLPSGVRAVITGISGRMALTEGGEGP